MIGQIVRGRGREQRVVRYETRTVTLVSDQGVRLIAVVLV